MYYKTFPIAALTVAILTSSSIAYAKNETTKPQAIPVTVESISTKEFVTTLDEVGKLMPLSQQNSRLVPPEN